MKPMVTVMMASLLGMLLASTAWGVPAISCNFESNSTWSTAAYADNTGDYDPDATVGGSWSSVYELAASDVQVTSYGTPGAHSGNNYLRVRRSTGAAFARLWSGVGSVNNQLGGAIKIDMWVRSDGGGWNNEVWVYGSAGDVTGVVYGPNTNHKVLYIKPDESAWLDTGLSWTANVWQHLVITLYMPSHTMDISLDGNLVTGLPLIGTSTWVNLFDFADPGGSGSSYFDDIVISNYDLIPLTGQVTLNDFRGDLSGVGVKVELRPTDGSPVRTERILLDANGRFTINNVLSGTYDIAIKADGWLQKVISSAPVSSNPTDIGIVPLTSGDLKGDNTVGSDLSAVLAHMDLMGDLGPGVTALDRGHRILLRKGLQIEAQAYPGSNPPYGDFDLPTWQASNFTAPNFETVDFAPLYLPAAPGIPWSRLDPEPGYPDLIADELPYLSNMIAFQYRDEQVMDNATYRAEAAAWLAEHRLKYPDVLGFTNQSGFSTTPAGMQAYMQAAHPDMLMFDVYPFNTGIPVGGSPTNLYSALTKYRSLALAGNDGTGATPIPYGLYLQTFKDNLGGWNRFPSDSEMRLQQFAGWTFGCTFARAWVYNKPQSDYDSPFFSGYGDTADLRTPAFDQIAETNRQSRNLGRTLVRLLSTDVRFVAGLHGSLPGVANSVPTGMSTWSAGADPYITSISATNLGSTNNGLRGDVLVGYFRPLLESDDGPAYTNQVYFMITNGLSDAAGLVADTRQQIRIDFNFQASGITSLQRLNRDTGTVETVELTSLGGALYRLTLVLDGGTGDLFKFNTGAPFVKNIDYVAPPPNYAQPVISCDFESNGTVSAAAYPNPNGDFDPDTAVGGSWSSVYELAPSDIQVTSYGTPGAHSGSNYLAVNRSTGAAFARLFSGAGTPLLGPVVQIGAWLRSDSGTWQNYISAYGSAGNNEVASVSYVGGNGISYLSGGGAAWTPTGLTYTPGQWQHIVISLDFGTQKMSISLDGNTVTNLPFNFATTYVNLFDFGSNNNTTQPCYFDDIVVSQLSSTPMPGLTLTGQIALGDFSGDYASVGITVEFLSQSGGMVPLRTEQVLLDSTGRFTVNNCTAGTCNVAIKAGTWLKKLITNVNLNSSADLGTITLINGDADGDNGITSTDLSVVLMNLDLAGN